MLEKIKKIVPKMIEEYKEWYKSDQYDEDIDQNVGMFISVVEDAFDEFINCENEDENE